jgi:hypothetical protein
MNTFNDLRLKIHKGTVQKYNESGEALLLALQEKPTPPIAIPSFIPAIPVKAVFRSEDISNFQTIGVEPNDNRHSRLFSYGGKEVGFEGDAYKNFIQFCEKVQKQDPFSLYISQGFLEDTVFDWVRERRCGTTSQALTDYFLPRCEAAIHELEVWIPIFHTYAQAEVSFADVTIKVFSQEMFETLRQYFPLSGIPEQGRESYMAMLDHYQNEVRELAAATMFVTAEPVRAYELVLEQAEKAVAILRIFSKAIFIPEISSCVALYGQKSLQSYLYFIFNKGIMSASSGGENAQDLPYYITNARLQVWRETNIAAFITLFFKTDRTKFEEVVFQTLMIYSRSTLTTNASDKLMYVFSALETLLSKGSGENLQQNVSDRMAFITTKIGKERKDIVSNYKAAYKLRSEYVHGGITVSKMEILNTFYYTTFRFFLEVVFNNLHHKTKEEFLVAIDVAIDSMKYS